MCKKGFLIIFLFFGYCSFSQSLKKAEKMEVNYQNCLDNGIDMLGCSNDYYKQMDNLLNEVYKKAKLKMSSSEIEKLKTEQLNWLKKRDLYFKKAYIEAKDEADGLGSDDLQMVFVDKKTEYVKDRVVFLIKKYKV
jgi:uncharacterized protein YecT (DUF1311 family)